MVNLLRLIQAHGFSPQKVSSSNGGEYHSPCPACGGKDRFSIQIGKNRYFCRQCRRTGDSIQFLRDFEGKSFKDAKQSVGHDFDVFLEKMEIRDFCDRECWSKRAMRFIRDCHRMLQRNQEALAIIQKRGITLDSINRYGLGWNGQARWEDPADWGFKIESKKVYLPAGIVIPSQDRDIVVKVKIRRAAWKQGDKFPKYFEMRGSQQQVLLLGQTVNLPTMILESELDAILLAQMAGDLCNFIALGGAMKRPDEQTNVLLKKSSLILYSLDDDEAGHRSYNWWRSRYPHLRIWVAAGFKSPGDAYLGGIDLRGWIEAGIDRYVHSIHVD